MLDVLAQPEYGILPGGPGFAGLSALAFNPATGSLATLNGNGLVGIWDIATRHQGRVIPGPTGYVPCRKL